MARYNAKESEQQWQAEWDARALFATPTHSDKPKAYVLETGVDPGDADARHADHYRRWLENLPAGFQPSTGAEREAFLDALCNIRRALKWSFGEDGDLEAGVALASVAAKAFLVESLLTECDPWTERAIGALDHTIAEAPVQERLLAARQAAQERL